MFGTRDQFTYFECSSCKTVQIVEIPPDLARYYPPDYYSFRNESRSSLVSWLRTQRDKHALGMTSLFGALLAMARADPLITVLREARLALGDRIVDVGCGSGDFLERLARVGFRELLGVDPYIDDNFSTHSGVPIRKCQLASLDGSIDALMFHHSLEHVLDPLSELKVAARLLRSGGLCLVRVPTPSSDAWQTYGVNWVQLDAPRHIVLPSREGMQIAAEKAGLKLERVIDDSSGRQFYGSEAYQSDIPLSALKRPSRLFPGSLEARARKLNAAGRGDQAAFFLRKN